MVFVKVRETYDLCTTKNKMTVIGVHTPRPDIIKKNFPGLLMQCKSYRPYSCDVRVACASVQPLDPLGVGTSEGDVAPEDVFNPILYKAMSNFGMSQIEARINYMGANNTGVDVVGNTSIVDVDSVTPVADEFNMYYGLLSNAHDWKHANPQAGLEMRGLRPLVYEMNYNIGDQANANGSGISGSDPGSPADGGLSYAIPWRAVLGGSKPFPFINTTSYTAPGVAGENTVPPGFTTLANNSEQDVPWMMVFVGCIIVPPSRLHQLFYRMVVEWTLEFSSIRPLCEIADWGGLQNVGSATHFQNYSYEATKEALTGSTDTILDSDTTMVSTNVNIKKVM